MPRISKNDQTGNDVDKLLLDAVPKYASGIPCVAARHSATFFPEPQCAQKFVQQEMMEMRDVWVHEALQLKQLKDHRCLTGYFEGRHTQVIYLGVHADRNRSLDSIAERKRCFRSGTSWWFNAPVMNCMFLSEVPTILSGLLLVFLACVCSLSCCVCVCFFLVVASHLCLKISSCYGLCCLCCLCLRCSCCCWWLLLLYLLSGLAL